ncbi:MAG: VCBS repeat-containing protein [Bacteroidota bacterium]
MRQKRKKTCTKQRQLTGGKFRNLDLLFTRIIPSFLLLSLILSCTQGDQQPSSPLFTLVPESTSGIQFVNRLPESPSQNVLTYEYYYNGAGLAATDLNFDGLPDLFFVSNLGAHACYLNEGSLTFRDVSALTGMSGRKGFYTGVSVVDINHDQKPDLYLSKSGRFTHPDLRRNELFVHQGLNEVGVPIFKEEAKKYGLDIPAYSSQASFFDYDRDGDLDMFLINHGIDPFAQDEIPALKDQRDQLSGVMLFENEAGFFREKTQEAGLENNRLGFGLGIGVGDINQDGWPDVYVSHDYAGRDHLYINRGQGKFTEEIRQMTGHTSFYSMGNDLGDINQDGWLDIVNLDMVAAENFGIKTSMSAMNPAQFHQVVAEGQHYQYMFNTLLLNNGVSQPGTLPYLSDIAQFAGIAHTDWSWAPLLMDFENDGQLDLFITNGIKRNIRNNDAMNQVRQLRVQMEQESSQQAKIARMQQMLQSFPYHRKPNYFFQNQGDLSFKNIGPALGIDSLPTASNGAVYADLDGDGDWEIIINNVDMPAHIYQNHTSEQGTHHFLQITAQGPEKNPQGIGLKVEIYEGPNMQVAELYPVRGYYSSVEPLLHFGLGEAKRLDSLIATWPDGKQQIIPQVKADQKLELDYQQASMPRKPSISSSPLFQSVGKKAGPLPRHEENLFDDFARESLLPHKMSQPGPGMAVGDVNQDGKADFFLGGARGFPAQLMIQEPDGRFSSVSVPLWNREKAFEDAAALFFDWDNDQDLDLMVGSGGNEKTELSAYPLRLYQNDGKGNFQPAAHLLPELNASVSVIVAGDVDRDGDQDVFIGSRQTPATYPMISPSYLLENTPEGFRSVGQQWAPAFQQLGMVTDARWADVNADQRLDLIVVGEWMAPQIWVNKGAYLEKDSLALASREQVGWWNALAVTDIDQDGDLDFIAGNLGENYKYKASPEAPFSIHADDFDGNGSLDIVLGYQEGTDVFPLRGRECSSNQMPFIKEKFPTYTEFGLANLEEVYGQKELAAAYQAFARNFATTCFLNQGQGRFEAMPLPSMAQLSSVNGIMAEDFDRDGHLDLLIGGNLWGAEVETPRADASIGLWLKGKGDGRFEAMPAARSGLQLTGEIKHFFPFSWQGQPGVIMGRNGGSVEILTY